MYKFYSPSSDILGNKIILKDKAQLHHLKDVLRLKIDDKIRVFDAQGNDYLCLIKEVFKDKAVLEIKERRLTKRGGIRLTVACAIPKKAKMDEIIDQLTQLGVESIIPMLTERVIVKLDAAKKLLRQERWEKIAKSASQQSQRDTLPVIELIQDIKEVVSQARNFELKLLPTLSGKSKALREVVAETQAKSIFILIGPEGDFTPEEVELAKKNGFIPVSLGDLVLRVDTAAIAVTSYIRFRG